MAEAESRQLSIIVFVAFVSLVVGFLERDQALLGTGLFNSDRYRILRIEEHIVLQFGTAQV